MLEDVRPISTAGKGGQFCHAPYGKGFIVQHSSSGTYHLEKWVFYCCHQYFKCVC